MYIKIFGNVRSKRAVRLMEEILIRKSPLLIVSRSCGKTLGY